MADGAGEYWHNSIIWPPAGAKWFRTESMRAFRRSYRDYRIGHAKGAKGEVFDVLSSSARPLKTEEDTIRDISIFQDSEDPQVIKHAQLLERYRQAYRQFRLGASKGAEGEVSKLALRFSRDQLRLLPVAALARCLSDQVRGEKAGAVCTFHCHLGAGKLGLGLVVPAMVVGKTPFAILQRPSDAWQAILNASNDSVQLRVNNCNICSVTVVRTGQDLLRMQCLYHVDGTAVTTFEIEKCSEYRIKASISEAPEAIQYRFLVLEPKLNPIFLLSSDAFSCSLGPAIKDLAKDIGMILPPNSGLSRPALYACENDHKAVDSVRDFLDAPLYVKECMIDRICSRRTIYADCIQVVAEPYEGEIVVSARYPSSILPGFGGPNIRMPRTSGAYSYLYQRKFLLVNGTHTTLAFMTLRKLCKDPADAPGDFELLAPNKMSSDEKRELRGWTAARCLVLLHSHEVEVIKIAHGVKSSKALINELWSHAEEIMARFSTVQDSTKRVLGGGVTNRYETRLKDVLKTLETFDKSVPLGNLLLGHTGFKSTIELKDTIRKLVKDAEPFSTLSDSSPDMSQAPQHLETYQRQFLA